MINLRRAASDESGAALAQFALILPIFLTLIFGVLEMGYAMYQFQQAHYASKHGLRIATTRNILVDGAFEDCGPGLSGMAPGQACNENAGSVGWTFSCNGAGAGSTYCDAARAQAISNRIRGVYPQVQDTQILYRFDGAGLGFNGLGRPVPIVTVTIQNVPIQFFVLRSFLGQNAITLPPVSASAPAEDLTNG